MVVWSRGAGSEPPGQEDPVFAQIYKIAALVVKQWDAVAKTTSIHLRKIDPFRRGEPSLPSAFVNYNAPGPGESSPTVNAPEGARASTVVVSDAASENSDSLRVRTNVGNLEPSSPSPIESIDYREIRVPAVVDEMAEQLALRTDNVGNYIYISLLALFFGLPLLIISSLYGYWIVVSNLTMGTCLAAAIVLFSVNFYKRVTRSYTVLMTLDNPPDTMSYQDYLRASYVATLGMDDGLNLISKIAGLAIGTGFWALVGTFFFLSVSRNIGFEISSGVVLLLGAILRTPIVLRYLSRFTESTYFVSNDNRSYYNGKHIWPAVTLYVLRFAFYGMGFMSLVYYDTDFDTNAVLGDSKSAKWLLIAIFVLIAMVRDMLFLIPLPTSENVTRAVKARGMMIASMTLFKVIIAIVARTIVGGYASSLALLASYMSIDFRHPRCSWTIYNNPYWSEHVSRRAKRRGIMNTRNTLRTLGFFVLAALSIGFVTGGTRSLPFPSLGQQNMLPEQQRSMFTSPLCTVRVRGLSVLDYSEMAFASYSQNASGIPSNWTATNYPRLAGFKAGISDSLDPTGQSFYIEYRAPPPSNLSVIAVRGTYSFSDILQDVYIYSTAVLLQSSSYAGTMINMWPIEIVALLVQSISKVGRTQFSLSYWEPVAKKVAYLRDVEKRDVVMTGHSLGGAIAGIVGANEDIPAIGISAPGLGLQSATYGFSLQRLTENFLNIVPNHDVVPDFDVQYGLIQDISCYKGEPLSCHSLTLTQETLQTLCGADL
ncbi:hypothetical protein BC831DRAFT_401812 [Entophlyctis helioformis]|nr:hypothetical protein BC831DRAFT_401812 [Entophlyctis helioformis]